MINKKTPALTALSLLTFSASSIATIHGNCISSGDIIVEKKLDGIYTADIDQDPNKKIAEAELSGYITFQGRDECLRVETNAAVDAILFDKALSIADVTVGATALGETELGADGRISVFGLDIVAQEFTLPKGASPLIEEKLPTIPVPDLEYEANILPLGPVNLGVSIGVRPSLDVNVRAGYEDLGLTAQVTPHANVDGFVEAAARIPFVKIGVGGEINIVSDKLSLETNARWLPGQVAFGIDYSIDNVADLAGGSLYAFINNNSPWTFLEWEGFTFENNLLAGEEILSIE